MTFAAFTGALLAAAGFVAVFSPVLAGAVHGAAREGCVTGAVILAAALFCGRVALTLRRFERQNRLHWRDPQGVDAPLSAGGGGETAGGAGAAETEAETGGAGGSARAGGDTARREPAGAPDQPSQPGRTSPDS